MKYMGSKRSMLKNGLGDILIAEARSASRVIDLFCGAGYVSWFAATHIRKPVISCDLQKYAAILAGSVVKRTKPVNAQDIKKLWLPRALKTRHQFENWEESEKLDTAGCSTKMWQHYAQELCSSDTIPDPPLIWQHYGGHYFSPTQALSFDSMLRTLPENEELRDLCLAAVIIAASHCVASPGHTAQPFKATQTGGPHLREAWLRDPFHYVREALDTLCSLYATKPGSTIVADANQLAEKLNKKDIVFVDPPYSAVQYSRFYHVLETIARGECSRVEGVGRYPPLDERPNSLYSRKTQSDQAISSLLSLLSKNKCKVILTFPQDECSNGLSGWKIDKIARQFFRVKSKSVKSKFSTLGGNRTNRAAKKISEEVIFVLTEM